MLLGYVYKLRPNSQPSNRMDNWLNLLRGSYNWSLADRIHTYEQRLIQGEYCDLRTKAVAYPLACCVTKGGATGEPWRDNGKRRSAGEIQITTLPQLKESRPWYKDVDSTVLQQNVKRLDKAYEKTGRFLKNGQSAKRGLNRSIADASWSELISKIEYVAAKSGKIVFRVNPRHSSQECSLCHHIDVDNRDGEKFLCTNCGHVDDANLQAARTIKHRAIEANQLVVQTLRKKVRRDSPEPKQLTLFETPTPELTEVKRRHLGARKSSPPGAWEPGKTARPVRPG